MIKKLQVFIILLIVLQVNAVAQYCSHDNRFTQIPVFTDAQIKEDSMVYATALNWQGISQQLKLNVFYPDNAIDPLSKRPMIMMIFGGAFINGDRSQVDAYCMNFAKRGFVAVGIDYRLGKETVTPCSDTLSQEKAVYRAVQDAHAAMRFMVANAGTYKIDTTWLFVGGYSAGAGTAMALVYNSQTEFNQVYPSIVAQLGNMDNSGNSLTNTFKIKGIFNNWGGVSSDFFDANEAVPTVSFHGGNDGVVPVDSAIDVTCFTTNHYIYGSHALYVKLTNAGVCSDLTVKPGAGHGVYQTVPGPTMRVNRATCFFKSLFCNTCSNYLATDSVTPDCSVIALGVKQNSFSNKFTVYPNPVTSELTILSASEINLTIHILNMFGELVSVKTAGTIDMTALKAGMYFLQIQQDSNFLIQKIIKE